MNKILLAAVIGLAAFKLLSAPTETTILYKVRCSGCLAEQVLAPTSVAANGGSSVTNNSVAGNLTTRTAFFHCPECHTDFTAGLPSIFIPASFAVPVAVAITTNVTRVVPLPGRPTPVATPTTDEIVRTINLPDGSQYIVIHRKPSK